MARRGDDFLRVHAQESLAAVGVAVPLADYLVDDAPMAAELEVLFVQPPGDGPLDRVQLSQLGTHLSSLFASDAISMRRTALSDFKRAFSSTRDPTCAMTS